MATRSVRSDLLAFPAIACKPRPARLSDVTASLVEMFSDAAILVARGQPPLNDVGWATGIVWQDVIEDLRQQVTLSA